MAITKSSDKNQTLNNSLFADCENAFNLIKAGKEKQAEEMFPLEYYLVQKYLYLDFKNLSDLLAKRLTV
jgi:hypothetical protein